MRVTLAAIAAIAAFTTSSAAIALDPSDANSLRAASKTLAYGLMSFYKNNQTSTPATQIGTFSPPLESWDWWEAGAVLGRYVLAKPLRAR